MVPEPALSAALPAVSVGQGQGQVPGPSTLSCFASNEQLPVLSHDLGGALPTEEAPPNGVSPVYRVGGRGGRGGTWL